MKETQRIADQLRRAFEGEAWHGPSLLEVLHGISAEQAARRPIPKAHSVWEIVNHLNAWAPVLLGRMRGKAGDLSGKKDWPPVRDASPAAWKKTLKTLHSARRQLLDAIARLPEARLQDTVPGRKHSLYVELHGIVQHDLYHAGQIAILKKAFTGS